MSNKESLIDFAARLACADCSLMECRDLGVGFEADAACEQRHDQLIQADAFGLGSSEKGGVE